MENNKLQMQVHPRGYVQSLVMKDDPYHMNWVIDNEYLKQASFNESDKLFGEFTITIDGQTINSTDNQPQVITKQQQVVVTYELLKKNTSNI
jgi:hypothetical protein